MLSSNVYNTILQPGANPNTLNYYYLTTQPQQQQQHKHHKHYSPTHTLMPTLQNNIKLIKPTQNQHKAVGHAHHQHATQIPIPITNDKKANKVKDLIAKHNANSNINTTTPYIVTNNKVEKPAIESSKVTSEKKITTAKNIDNTTKKEQSKPNSVSSINEPIKTETPKANKTTALQTTVTSSGSGNNKTIESNNKLSAATSTKAKSTLDNNTTINITSPKTTYNSTPVATTTTWVTTTTKTSPTVTATNTTSTSTTNTAPATTTTKPVVTSASTNSTSTTSTTLLSTTTTASTANISSTTSTTAFTTNPASTTTKPVATLASTNIPSTTSTSNINVDKIEKVKSSAFFDLIEVNQDTNKSNEINLKHEFSTPHLSSINISQNNNIDKIEKVTSSTAPIEFKEIDSFINKSYDIKMKNEFSTSQLTTVNISQNNININRASSNINTHFTPTNLTLPATSTPAISTDISTPSTNPNGLITFTTLAKKPRFKTIHIEPNVVREAAARIDNNDSILSRVQAPSVDNLKKQNESFLNRQINFTTATNEISTNSLSVNNIEKNLSLLINETINYNLGEKNKQQNENIDQPQQPMQQQNNKENLILKDYSSVEKEINNYYNTLNNVYKSSTKTYESSNSLKSSINSLTSNVSMTQSNGQKQLENNMEKQQSQQLILQKQQQLKNSNIHQGIQSTSDYSSFNSQHSNNFTKVPTNTNVVVELPAQAQTNLTAPNNEIIRNKSVITEKPKEIITPQQQQQQQQQQQKPEIPQIRQVREFEFKKLDQTPNANERITILPVQLNKLENRKNYNESDYKKYIDNLKLIRSKEQNGNNTTPHNSRTSRRPDKTLAENSPTSYKSPVRVIKLNNVARKTRQPSNPPPIKVQNKNIDQKRAESNENQNNITNINANSEKKSKENSGDMSIIDREIVFYQNAQKTENKPITFENCILNSNLENVEIVKTPDLENRKVIILNTNTNNSNNTGRQDVNMQNTPLTNEIQVVNNANVKIAEKVDHEKIVEVVKVTDPQANRNLVKNRIVKVQEKPFKVHQLPPPPPTLTPRTSVCNSNNSSNSNATQTISADNVNVRKINHVTDPPKKSDNLSNNLADQLLNNIEKPNIKENQTNGTLSTKNVKDVVEDKNKSQIKIEKQQEVKEEKKIETSLPETTVKQIIEAPKEVKLQSHFADIKLPLNLIKNIEKTIEKQQIQPPNSMQMVQQKIGTLYAPNRKNRQPLFNPELPLIRQLHVDSNGTTFSTIEEPSNPYTNKVNLPNIDGIDYYYKNKHDNKINISNYLNIPQSQSHSSPYFAEFNNLLSGKPSNIPFAPLVEPIKLCDKSSSLPWMNKFTSKNKNFYQNYVEENNKRKKEGNSFLMLLPGIAIPVDTDILDSDDEYGHK